MKKIILSIALLCACVVSAFAQVEKPANIWIHYADRFCAPDSLSLENVDSVEFAKSSLKRYRYNANTGKVTGLSKSYPTKEDVTFDFDFARYLVKPSTYSSCDFTKETSQWCFQRSMETEHFICFWEKGLTLSNNSVSYNGFSVNIKTLLNRGETILKKYVGELGFLNLDGVKIEMFIVKESANGEPWRADGSGVDGTTYYYNGTTKSSKSAQVGLFHCTPWAANAEGGHTAAHEIGHVFQYLISAKYGERRGWRWGYGVNGSGGNAWWESCAQWQAFNVYPSTLFTNGYYDQNVSSAHKHLLHEDWRYANYFIQYYWCQLFGQDFIGKLWQATKFPEDPIDTYLRMNNATIADFNKMFFDYACRAATWDIDGIRTRGKSYQNAFSTSLHWVEGTQNTYAVDAACCPQNYGMNIIQLRGIKAGEAVKVHFKGIAGADGYRKINVSKAGWRYGFVAQTTDDERVYGEMYSDKEGVAEMTMPENVRRAWFVVTGAPTEHWHHPWDEDESNDEQLPYEVTFEGCSAQGTSRIYTAADFPEDYVRKDTTVVIEANLAYDASGYSSVRVQYDTDAISQALGITTAQLKKIKRNDTTSNAGDVRFAGVNSNGTTLNFNTTTSTSSATCYGHWFGSTGNVVDYGSSSYIYAEMLPDSFGCNVGQYPGRLTKGKTYKVRQAVVYTHTDGKMYKAIMEVHLTVN